MIVHPIEHTYTLIYDYLHASKITLKDMSKIGFPLLIANQDKTQ